jgi:hypothetical protein
MSFSFKNKYQELSQKKSKGQIQRTFREGKEKQQGVKTGKSLSLTL